MHSLPQKSSLLISLCLVASFFRSSIQMANKDQQNCTDNAKIEKEDEMHKPPLYDNSSTSSVRYTIDHFTSLIKRNLIVSFCFHDIINVPNLTINYIADCLAMPVSK